ncbi:hypothetical protein, partial [Phyllobacterium ifriqiyense]|uniref:hypothetical protein n=1 Tax=Phyllobacterium ifriqiyense TaxID=314238 RepID=UPI003391AB91
HSVFWGSMAYTLIGGTAAGTVMILLFLPALYAVWFRIEPPKQASQPEATIDERHSATALAPE